MVQALSDAEEGPCIGQIPKSFQEGTNMLPKDPMILFSFLNTKLRDQYSSLEALCEDMEADQQALLDAMASVGFHYDPERNAFI
jgi:hypothetical protein